MTVFCSLCSVSCSLKWFPSLNQDIVLYCGLLLMIWHFMVTESPFFTMASPGLVMFTEFPLFTMASPGLNVICNFGESGGAEGQWGRGQRILRGCKVVRSCLAFLLIKQWPACSICGVQPLTVTPVSMGWQLSLPPTRFCSSHPQFWKVWSPPAARSIPNTVN